MSRKERSRRGERRHGHRTNLLHSPKRLKERNTRVCKNVFKSDLFSGCLNYATLSYSAFGHAKNEVGEASEDMAAAASSAGDLLQGTLIIIE